MAVRFLIAFFLISCGASAQVFQTNNVPYKFRGLKADSMLVVPSGFDTSAMANPKWGEGMNGALFFRTKDSTLWGKAGSRWVQIGGGLSIAGGDTTTFEVVDSTGQPARRVLFSKSGNKIGSSGYFLWDTINNKLVINSPLIASGGSVYKLFVNGDAAFDDVLADSANLNYMSTQKVNGLTATDDTSTYKPIAWNSSTKTWASFGRWPVPPTIDTSSLSNRINQKVDSVTSSNDSLYYYVNGSRYYVSSFTGLDTAVVVKAQVHNAESTTLLAGEVVYSFGATGNLMSVKRAWNKQDATSSKTFGVVRKDIPAGGIGWIVTNGVVDKLNLGAYSEGDQVYLDSIPGQFTATKPYAPYHMVAVGVIERANNGNGQIYVKVQNGYELDELHNVSARFPLNNQVLKFRTSDSLWHNATDTGITRLAAIGSTPNANGASITGDTLRLQPADASFGGVVTTAAQTFAGTKTFTPAANTSSIVSSGYSLTGSNAQPLMDLSGTWNTTGTPTLIRANVTNTASNNLSRLIDLQRGSSSRFYVDILGRTYIELSLDVNNINIASMQTSVASNSISNSSNHIATSGASSFINSQTNFIPSSGTATFTSFNSRPTINQTGGANGITRGLYVNPTLTAAADWRSIEWSNNTGRGLWGAGTAENAMAGPTTIGAAASPNASAVLDLTSTTRGFLPPRMTAVQRTGIANTAGLLVWDTDSSRYMLNTGSAWRGLVYTGESSGASIDSISIRRFGTGFAQNIRSWNAGSGGASIGGANNTSSNDSVSIFIGYIAGNDVTTGDRNILIGSQSGRKITTGHSNVAIGHKTLGGNTGATAMTGVGNVAIGMQNTNQTAGSRLGPLANNTSGSYNIAIGSSYQSTQPTPLSNNTSGNSNIAIGASTLGQNTTTGDNTAVGYQALQSSTTASNTAIGAAAASQLTSGTITAVGASAGLTTTTGSGVFIGRFAGAASGSGGTQNITGINLVIGSNAFRYNSANNQNATNAHTRNTIVGNNSTPLSTTTVITDNVFLGESAGQAYGDGSPTAITGSQNIAIGSVSTLMSLSQGYQFVLGSGNNAVNRWMISDTAGTTRRWVINGSTTSVSATTASAALEIRSTAGGFLPPRMTSANVAAIATPAIGLSVYDSTDKTNDVYDGTRWNNQPNGLKNSATLDFGNTAAQTSTDLAITVTGAADGDMVFLGTPNASVNANTNFTAWVSAANTVTIRFNNYSSGAIDPASGTFRVYVIKN